MIDHTYLPYEIRKTADELFAGKTGFSLEEMKIFFTEEIQKVLQQQPAWRLKGETFWERMGVMALRMDIDYKLSPPQFARRDKGFEYWLSLLPLEGQKELLLSLCAKPDFPMQYGKPTQQQRDRLKTMLTTIAIDSQVSSALQILNSPMIQDSWMKAVERCRDDPNGAITSARTLLESTCKHLLEKCGSSYNEKDDLPRLYKHTAQALNIAANQQSEQVLHQIFGGCYAVVQGVGTLRNQLGDAHGAGRTGVVPTLPMALFSVNLAGSMAMFLVQTWEASSGGSH